MGYRWRSVAAVGSALAIVLVLGMGPVQPARADPSACSGDSCDGYQWQAARGVANEISYWGMDPGHNCTNYVAWRLANNGVGQPTPGLGDAATWADRALAAGYPVNSVPIVGSVAQWDAHADGNGPEGHVAYVESVNPDGTLVVSEDYWHGGEQDGPLTFRTVLASSVSHFIHFGDVSQWLRLAGPDSGAWRVLSTTLTVGLTAMSAVTMGGATPWVFYSQDGQLFEARSTATGWAVTPTGLATHNTSMSAVNMGGGWPQVATVDGGTLFLSTASAGGWQKVSTGLRVAGEISAVNTGGADPTIMIAQYGMLLVAWRDLDGWHAKPTGLGITGRISAVAGGGVWPEVYSTENGQLTASWFDGHRWRQQGTGIALSGSFSAVRVAGITRVVAAEGGALVDIVGDTSGWHTVSTGVGAGAEIAAVDRGDGSPLVIQAG